MSDARDVYKMMGHAVSYEIYTGICADVTFPYNFIPGLHRIIIFFAQIPVSKLKKFSFYLVTQKEINSFCGDGRRGTFMQEVHSAFTTRSTIG